MIFLLAVCISFYAHADFFTACFEGRVQDVSQCLVPGFDINQKNNMQYTGLMLAARKGHTDVARLLLSFGADPDVVGFYDNTALHVACRWGHVNIAQLLLDHQASINQKNGAQMTPLMCAVIGGHIDVVRELLKRHPDINEIDSAGRTALKLALDYNRDKIAALLRKNEGEVTPLDGVIDKIFTYYWILWFGQSKPEESFERSHDVEQSPSLLDQYDYSDWSDF